MSDSSGTSMCPSTALVPIHKNDGVSHKHLGGIHPRNNHNRPIKNFISYEQPSCESQSSSHRCTATYVGARGDISRIDEHHRDEMAWDRVFIEAVIAGPGMWYLSLIKKNPISRKKSHLVPIWACVNWYIEEIRLVLEPNRKPNNVAASLAIEMSKHQRILTLYSSLLRPIDIHPYPSVGRGLKERSLLCDTTIERAD